MDTTKVSMKDRVLYASIFWSITVIGAVYVIPLVLLVYLNPFWFRDAAHRWAQMQIRAINCWRAQQVQFIVNKYRIFDVMKKA